MRTCTRGTSTRNMVVTPGSWPRSALATDLLQALVHHLSRPVGFAAWRERMQLVGRGPHQRGNRWYGRRITELGEEPTERGHPPERSEVYLETDASDEPVVSTMGMLWLRRVHYDPFVGMPLRLLFNPYVFKFNSTGKSNHNDGRAHRQFHRKVLARHKAWAIYGYIYRYIYTHIFVNMTNNISINIVINISINMIIELRIYIYI